MTVIPTRKARSRSWWALGVLLILAACGGDNGTGTTGPTFPEARGTYTGTWTLDLTVLATGDQVAVSCPGSITISGQNGSSLRGSFIYNQSASCDATSGTVTGTIRTDGGVTLSFTIPGSNSSLEDITGCAVVSEDDAMAVG